MTMFVTTIRVEYEAHHSGDAEHLAALMRARLDDLTPHSTNVRIEDWPKQRQNWGDERRMNEPRECVACGRPCPPGYRWCSNTCFYQEDGYPDDPVEPDAEEDEA